MGIFKIDAYDFEWIGGAKDESGMGAMAVAQSAIAMIGTAAVMDEVNWVMVASGAALAGVLSFLTSLAGLPEE